MFFYRLVLGTMAMAEQIIKVIERLKSRVLIVRRADGVFTYRKQWSEGSSWGTAGPDIGVYDTAETAEKEARSSVWWLANDAP